MSHLIKRKGLLNKILIVSFGSALLLFFGYIFFTKRPGKQFYLPNGYSGWVTVRYEKEGAPPLKKVRGKYQVLVPRSGIVETSTKLDFGWGKDEYFWWTGDQPNLEKVSKIKKWKEEDGETKGFIHDATKENMYLIDIAADMEIDSDTVLWEGTKIKKRLRKDGDPIANIRTGRKVLEHFFVSEQRELYGYRHDTLPQERKYW